MNVVFNAWCGPLMLDRCSRLVGSCGALSTKPITDDL
jgi:hypothetical protein